MQWLIQFVIGHRAYVTLGLTVLASLVLMALPYSDKSSLAREATSTLLSAGHRVFAWPMDITDLRHENEVLREQNLRLSLELLALREARLENLRLSRLLQFRKDEGGGTAYVSSKVIARDPDRVQNTLLIDVGTRQGVQARMSVFTPDGLVGRVLEAHPDASVVLLLLDRNCQVSAIVQRRNRARGVVSCENEVFRLKHIPLRTDIEVGDRVVSSGLGGIFPKGLLIGTVAEVGEEEQGLFREVALEPGVQFQNLEEVFVLTE